MAIRLAAVWRGEPRRAEVKRRWLCLAGSGVRCLCIGGSVRSGTRTANAEAMDVYKKGRAAAQGLRQGNGILQPEDPDNHSAPSPGLWSQRPGLEKTVFDDDKREREAPETCGVWTGPFGREATSSSPGYLSTSYPYIVPKLFFSVVLCERRSPSSFPIVHLDARVHGDSASIQRCSGAL